MSSFKSEIQHFSSPTEATAILSFIVSQMITTNVIRQKTQMGVIRLSGSRKQLEINVSQSFWELRHIYCLLYNL